MEFNWLAGVGLFFVAALLDAIFALYTVAVIKTKPMRAASLSLLTYSLEALGVVSYVRDKWYLIPLALGAFVGSYVVVKYESIQKQKKRELKKLKSADRLEK